MALGFGEGLTLQPVETGTFTPTFAGETNHGTAAYSRQNGQFTKIGQMVIASIDVALTSKGTSSGSLSIQGLPFPLVTGKKAAAAVSHFGIDISGTGNAFEVFAETNIGAVDQLILLLSLTSGGSIGLGTPDITDTASLVLTLIYYTED